MSGATPRVTRSRNNTPLPAVSTRQSHAYGAQGKAALSEQVTSSAADVNAAFTTTMRRSQAQRASTRQASLDSTTPALAKKATRKTRATTPLIEEEVEDSISERNEFRRSIHGQDETAQSDDERPGTSLQHSAAYINPTTFSTARRAPAAKAPQIRAAVQEAFLDDDEVAHEPWLVTVFFHTVPRYIKWFYGDGWRRIFLVILTLMLLITALCSSVFLGALGFTIMPLPESWQPYRTDILYRAGILFGLPGYNQPPQELNERWQRFTHDQMFSDLLPEFNMPEQQWAINAHLLGRVESTENRTAALRQHAATHQAMVAELQDILPKIIVVKEENGEFVIPPIFWKALAQKMQSSDASPIWDHFINSNHEKYRAYTQEFLAERFEGLYKDHHLLTQEEFQKVLSQHTSSQRNELEQVIRKSKLSLLEEARSIARDVLEKSEVMSLARQQIAALGHANYVHNLDKKLRQINYFAVGLGAIVDPHYTSDTKMPATTTWLQSMLHHSGLARQYPNPPAMALTGWEEATDAWCAATSQDEKAMAQLTVKLPHKIFPEEIIIEHVPATGTRDIKSAPRDFEVWIQVDDIDRLPQSKVAVLWERRDHTKAREACQSSPPNGETNWICVAGEHYNIRGHNFIQDYTIQPELKPLGIATDRIAIRVLNNWGSKDHTCLYRVRVTGKEVIESQK